MAEIMSFISGATYPETVLNMLFLMMCIDGVVIILYAILKGTK